MKQLTNRGFSHLLVPVLAFLLVAGLGGAYFLAKSHAATSTSSTSQSTTTSSTSTSEPASGGTDASLSDTAALAANANAAAAQNSSGGVKLCLYYASSYCMITNGTGGQSNTISTNAQAWASWNIYVVGGNKVEFQNGAGNCLRNNSDQTVTMTSGRCSGEDGELWWVTQDSPYFHYESYKFSSNHWYLGTNGAVSGNKVWSLDKFKPGVWISWGEANK